MGGCCSRKKPDDEGTAMSPENMEKEPGQKKPSGAKKQRSANQQFLETLKDIPLLSTASLSDQRKLAESPAQREFKKGDDDISDYDESSMKISNELDTSSSNDSSKENTESVRPDTIPLDWFLTHLPFNELGDLSYDHIEALRGPSFLRRKLLICGYIRETERIGIEHIPHSLYGVIFDFHSRFQGLDKAVAFERDGRRNLGLTGYGTNKWNIEVTLNGAYKLRFHQNDKFKEQVDGRYLGCKWITSWPLDSKVSRSTMLVEDIDRAIVFKMEYTDDYNHDEIYIDNLSHRLMPSKDHVFLKSRDMIKGKGSSRKSKYKLNGILPPFGQKWRVIPEDEPVEEWRLYHRDNMRRADSGGTGSGLGIGDRTGMTRVEALEWRATYWDRCECIHCQPDIYSELLNCNDPWNEKRDLAAKREILHGETSYNRKVISRERGRNKVQRKRKYKRRDRKRLDRKLWNSDDNRSRLGRKVKKYGLKGLYE